MSDGPYRSLNMRPAWKQVAERAAKPAFELEEIRDSIQRALEQDGRKEIPASFVRKVRSVLADGDQGRLFVAEEMFDQLRSEAAGYPLASVFLDRVIQGARCGDAVENACRDTLAERAASGMRQIEEHGLRQERDVGYMRKRLRDAIGQLGFDAISRRVLGKIPGSRARILKTGIDDGVSLR